MVRFAASLPLRSSANLPCSAALPVPRDACGTTKTLLPLKIVVISGAGAGLARRSLTRQAGWRVASCWLMTAETPSPRMVMP